MAILVCGLGNPGSRFEGSRHNVGFAVVDRISHQHETALKKPLFRKYRCAEIHVSDARMLVVEPLTYMNRSGEVLPGIMRRHRLDPDDLVVIFDTLDLAPGVCRFKKKGSAGGHRGVQSVIDVLGTDQFCRFSIGIGRPESGETVISHVLGRPDLTDAGLIETCVDRTARALVDLASKGPDFTIQAFNSHG